MRIWTMMYGLVWLSFVQIVVIIFPVLGLPSALDLHLIVGTAVVLLAYYVFLQVKRTSCPERVKRITKATAYLGIIQAILGLLLYLALRLGEGVPLQGFILFLHVVVAVAIITQASSSATAFDMWEEGEFSPASPA